MPELQKIAHELRPAGLELVTVMLDGNPRAGRSLANRIGLSAPIVVGDDQLRRRMRVSAYPWTLVLDRSGAPVYSIRGARDGDQFREIFDRYL